VRARFFLFLLAWSGLAFLSDAWAQEKTSTPAPGDLAPAVSAAGPAPAAELSLRDSLVLGLVEGITEFLPISSTGHLIIADHALGLEAEAPLQDATGKTLWYKKPSAHYPAGIPLTIKLAANTYIVVIQIGAIAAVVVIYYAQLFGIIRGLFGQNADGLRLLRNIVLGCLPAGVLGVFFNEWIDEHLFSVQAVIVALISGAVLMFAAERWRRDQTVKSSRLEPADLSAKQALGVGVMQCLALWPGMSRSMVTMVGGYFCGLTPAKAAEFSFLLGLPTLTGAALLKGVTSGPAMITVFGLPHVLLGGAVAALSAGAAVTFLVRYLTRHGLGVFAAYRILLAVLLGAWFFV
jgi:undecaprenyl-diphosphatase